MIPSFGLFTVSQDNRLLNMNSWTSDLVGIDYGSDYTNHLVQDFLNGLSSMTENPTRTQSALDIGIKNIQDYPVINLNFRKNGKRHLQLFLFPGDINTLYIWGGMILDRTVENNTFLNQVKILENLSTEARKIGASLDGNLEALRGNIHTWTGDVIEDFLLGIRVQVNEINNQLDQLLLFENSLNRFRFLPEIIKFEDLIGSILRKNSDLSHRVKWIISDDVETPAINVDPGLTSTALEYMLVELLKVIPAEQQIDISGHVLDDGIKVDIGCSLPMTLPGLEEESVSITPRDLNTRLYLAQRIILAQGGEAKINDLITEPRMGFSIDLYFPTVVHQERYPGIIEGQPQDVQISGRILLAEAQPEYQILLSRALEDKGYRVDLAIEGGAVLDITQRINPDLVLIDRNLPELDGILVTQGIRRWSSVPIIMVSSRTNPDDLTHAFQTGVDDYVRKPFQIEELLVRVQTAVRRGQNAGQVFTPETFSAGDVRINYSTRQVWIRASHVDLTPIEYNLLSYMSRHQRQVLPYEQMIERAWEGPEKGTRQGLFVHIRRLRDKIEMDTKEPKIIQNKWGVGYIFSP